MWFLSIFFFLPLPRVIHRPWLSIYVTTVRPVMLQPKRSATAIACYCQGTDSALSKCPSHKKEQSNAPTMNFEHPVWIDVHQTGLQGVKVATKEAAKIAKELKLDIMLLQEQYNKDKCFLIKTLTDLKAAVMFLTKTQQLQFTSSVYHRQSRHNITASQDKSVYSGSGSNSKNDHSSNVSVSNMFS